MTSRFWFVVLMAGSVAACVSSAELTTAREGSRDASDRNENAVLEYLRPVISSSGKAIRLYYRAACQATNDTGAYAPVPFPFTKVQPPSKGKTGLDAVREIFENDKNVTVTEEPIGTIRIKIGKVPTAILGTKLSLLTFDRDAQYNQFIAIRAIINSKEMEAAMRSLAVTPVSDLGGTVAYPESDVPHLPASIRNVTVDQALDMIAKTLNGIVVYGACAKPTEADGETMFWID